MHAVLARHLKRLGLDPTVPPDNASWFALLEVLSESWHDNDRDRYMLERSISISSREMKVLYEELKRSSESQLAIERDRLRFAVAEAQRLNQFLDSIIENLPETVFVKDADDLTYVLFNRAGQKLLGVSEDALVGKNDYDFFPPDQAEEFIRQDREVLGGREIVETLDEPIDTRYLGTRRLHTKKIPILDGDGHPKYLLGIAHDVTELRQQAEELARARDAAEAASRAKSEFLANMSHELRTPLNAIIGFAEVLKDRLRGPLNPKQARDVDHVLDSGRHLLRVINDILDLSRVEAGRCDLDLVELDVQDVLGGAVAIVAPLAEKKNTTIDIEAFEQSLYVQADELRLRQILFNLLSNAVKFSSEGGKVAVWADADERGQVTVSVRDDGVGITETDQSRIFDAFEQVDASHARRQQGTGLGLALTRRLVELHGGRIWLESQLGVGSVFHFTLQAAAARIPARPERANVRSA
jgi:PAS domain S-box-containing protein